MKFNLIIASVSLCFSQLCAMETVPEPTNKTLSLFTAVSNSISQHFQAKPLPPLLNGDVWEHVIIPNALKGENNIRSYAQLSRVCKHFHTWSSNSLIHLDLAALAKKTPYRSMTLLGYIISHQLPLRFPNLQALTLDLSLPGNDFFKELGRKVEAPDKFLNLGDSLKFRAADQRLNTVATVQSVVQPIVEKNANRSIRDLHFSDLMRMGLDLGFEYYKDHKTNKLLEIKEEDPSHSRSDYDKIIQESMLNCLEKLKELPNLRSLTIVYNDFFTYEQFFESFLKNLPALTNLHLIKPQKFRYATYNYIDLRKFNHFENSSNLTSFSLDGFLYADSFKGWEKFKNLRSLVLHQSNTNLNTLSESLATYLPQIESLHLISSHFEAFPPLQNLTQLQHLGFIDSPINDDDLVSIADLIGLKKLSLIQIRDQKYGEKKKYTEKGLSLLKTKRPDLTIILG